MDSVIDRVTIINWALADLGASPVMSIDDGSDQAGTVAQCWQRCVDHCFSLHDWHDFRKSFRLERAPDRPFNGWAFEHFLPGVRIGGALKVMQAGSTEPVRDFDREGASIFSNHDDLWVRLKVYLDPQHWEPGFRAAFTVALAAYLAVPIRSSTDMRDTLMAQAFGTPSREGTGGMFGRLIAQDRAAAPIGRPIANAEPVLGDRTGSRPAPWHGSF